MPAAGDNWEARYLRGARLPESPSARLPVYLARVDIMADIARAHGGHWPTIPRKPGSLPRLTEWAARRRLYGNAQQAHTYRRTTWTLGVQLPTVEDLAPVDSVEVSTALRDPARVDATPHRPQDLKQTPPTALPRGGDPVSVALRRGVCGHHYARTSPGGAPT
jgi:hypothetical protein